MGGLRQAFKNAIIKIQKDTFKSGLVGKPLPNGSYVIDVPGLVNCIYVQLVRTEGTTIATALNDGIPRDAGVEVHLQEAAAHPLAKNMPVDYVVLGRVVYGDEDDPGTANTGAAAGSSVPPHSHAIGSGNVDYVESRRYLPGLVYPGTGLNVVVKPFVYVNKDRQLRIYPGETVDVTSNVPATAFTHQWCVIGIDEATNAAVVVEVGEVSVGTDLTDADLDEFEGFPDIPLAAFPLRNAFTQVSLYSSDWRDLRNMLTGGLYTLPDLEALFSSPPPLGDVAPQTVDAIKYTLVHSGGLTYRLVIDALARMIERSIASASEGIVDIWKRARGDLDTPAAVQTNDVLGQLDFEGHDGGGYDDGFSLRVIADGTWANNDHPTRVEIWNTPDGSGTAVKRIVLHPNGTWEYQAGTTSHAPLRILPGSAPSSPVDGDIWTQDHKIGTRQGGITTYPTLGDYTQTTFVSNGSSSAENTYVGSSEGAPNYPANFFNVGTVLLLEWSGILSLSPTSNTLTFRVKLGSTTIGTFSFTGSTNNVRFYVRLFITCVATGASSTIRATGYMLVNGTVVHSGTSGLFNVNTANAQQFSCTIQCSSATGTVSTDQACLVRVK